MPVTWLHISDLHVRSGDSYDRHVVFRALVRSVRHFRERDGRSPDLIFATGDVAYSGKRDEYATATEFFDQLLDAAGLGRRQLYVVPGNHDVDRVVGFQLTRELGSRTAADDYFHPDTPKLHLTQKLGAFLHWHQDYFDGIRAMPENSTCGPAELVQVRGRKLGILPINTALFCQDDQDHERLFVGRRCLDAALEELNRLDADLRIALMHHPLQDLSDLERQHIRAGLVDNLDVILTGHLHEAGFAAVDMWRGRNLYCAAGAAYQTRDRPNTAYYATSDRDHLTIFPIRYEDQPREVWTLDTSLFPYEPGYEMAFPVPRVSNFRSFRVPGRDDLNRVRSRAPESSTRPEAEILPRSGNVPGPIAADARGATETGKVKGPRTTKTDNKVAAKSKKKRRT
jgi:predicted phosphodiesterase